MFANIVLTLASFAFSPVVQGGDALEPYNFRLEYSPGSGPKIDTTTGEFYFSDFTINGRKLIWPLECNSTVETPTGYRKAYGTSINATVVDDGGKTYQIDLLAQAQSIIWSVSQLPPNSEFIIRARLYSKTPTVRLLSPPQASFGAPVIQTSIGDPDFYCDLAYDAVNDRTYKIEPKLLGNIGSAMPDGSRLFEWRGTTSASGEANANVINVTYFAYAHELKLAPGCITPASGERAISGWRSRGVSADGDNANDLLLEAKFINENLRQFGLNYFIIDDGWQKKDAAPGAARSLAADPARFPNGLAAVASQLRSLGLRPGIVWFPQMAENASAAGLLEHINKTPVGGEELGPFLLNSGNADAKSVMASRAKKFVEDGFELLYLDGQREYVAILKNVEQEDLKKFDATKSYRSGIEEIRKAVGAGVAIACGALLSKTHLTYGIVPPPQDELWGLFDLIKTGKAVSSDRDGFITFGSTVGRNARGSGVIARPEPDTVRVGGKLTLDEARAWASLASLSGQAIILNESLRTLPAERIDILKRVLPVAPIRNAYAPPDVISPRAVFLWREMSNETSLVVGYFKYHSKESEIEYWFHSDRTLKYLSNTERFDYWSNRFLGRVTPETYNQLYIPDGECAVVATRKARPHPFVISTSRHVTQGVLDLKEEKYDEASMTLSGVSEVVANDPYELRIVMPDREWEIANIESSAADPNSKAIVENRLARVRLVSQESKSAEWKVKFKKTARVPGAPERSAWQITNLSAKPGREPSIHLEWSAEKSPTGMYLIKRDGIMIAAALSNSFVDSWSSLSFGESYAYEITAVDDEGHEGPPARIVVKTVQPPRVKLVNFGYDQRRSAAPPVGINQTIKNTPLILGGIEYKEGIGVAPPSILDIPLRGATGSFVATVGIDDMVGKFGSATITFFVDDKQTFQTPVLRGGEKPILVRFRIPRGEKLTMRVEEAGDGWDSDFVDVIEPEIRVVAPPKKNK
ncbi:MAG: NPCBM/NEW2 domain-containing protein [Planctomycetota bacterium]